MKNSVLRKEKDNLEKYYYQEKDLLCATVGNLQNNLTFCTRMSPLGRHRKSLKKYKIKNFNFFIINVFLNI